MYVAVLRSDNGAGSSASVGVAVPAIVTIRLCGRELLRC